MKNIYFVILLFTFSLQACTQTKSADATKSISQEKTALDASTRHHEWVNFEREDGSLLKAFVVYPEVSAAADAVIIIHENRGLNDWARDFADELAAKGYLVIAPDLISNTVKGIEKTTDFETSDDARQAIYALDQAMVISDLDAVFNYIKSDPASTSKVSVIGFCWGGSQSFNYATNQPELNKAFIFYGTAPKDSTVYSQINAPVYGFYGGADNRVNATIDQTKKYMAAENKFYETVIYENAGHAFMRRGAAPDTDEANKKAHDLAWERLIELLQN